MHEQYNMKLSAVGGRDTVTINAVDIKFVLKVKQLLEQEGLTVTDVYKITGLMQELGTIKKHSIINFTDKDISGFLGEEYE